LTITPEGARYTKARQVWREAHLDTPAEQTWDWIREALIEAAGWAGDAGVTLALQNHAPVTNSPADMLRMIREVDSPHVKACLDAPLAARQGVTSMQDAAREVAGLQVLSHFGGEYQPAADGSILGLVRNPDETLTPENYYLDFALGMQEIGYEGYIGYELCHPIPPVDGEPVGLDFADLNAKLAAEYMRGVLAEAARTPAVARAV
jgi:sugar phosphate isomerase/epimerase